MEDISQDDKIRLTGIFKSIYDNLGSRFVSLDKQSNEIAGRLEVIQQKLMGHFQKQCSKEFDWISKHSEKGANGELEIKFEDKEASEAQAQMAAWDNCTSKHDFGTKEFFKNIESKQNSLQNNNEDCIKNCVLSVKKSTDDQIKSCLNSCFDKVFQDTADINSNVLKKIGDIESKL